MTSTLAVAARFLYLYLDIVTQSNLNIIFSSFLGNSGSYRDRSGASAHSPQLYHPDSIVTLSPPADSQFTLLVALPASYNVVGQHYQSFQLTPVSQVFSFHHELLQNHCRWRESVKEDTFESIFKVQFYSQVNKALATGVKDAFKFVEVHILVGWLNFYIPCCIFGRLLLGLETYYYGFKVSVRNSYSNLPFL